MDGYGGMAHLEGMCLTASKASKRNGDFFHFFGRGLTAVLAGSCLTAAAGVGQLVSPVELIPLRQEAGRSVGIYGQRAAGGELILTPDTCFFYGALRLAGPVAPHYPGAELNGGKSWTMIEGLARPEQRAVWPLWLPGAERLKVAVFMVVPASEAGAGLEISLGEAKQRVVTQVSDGSVAQPGLVELPVPAAGLAELAVRVVQPGPGKTAGAVLRLVVTGAEQGVLVRSRWRPAAIHARFGSSELAQAGGECRLWVMEVRPLPCEDSMYAPITTPFGYFGSTFEPGGGSGGINFSMWSFGRGDAEPPVAQLSHLMALGDPRQEFGGFNGEGTGVKPRGWNPFEGEKIHSAVLALRLDPGEPYDTYTGYFLEPATGKWKLYAAGRKWSGGGRRGRSLLPGSFVEVPGPPDIQRTAQIRRGADFRGWCRDERGKWHALDEMAVGDIKAGEPMEKTAVLSADGWFTLAMGGLEQYSYATSKPVIRSAPFQPLPGYLAPEQLAALDAMSATVTVAPAGPGRVRYEIGGTARSGRVTLFYGAKDMLTFAERWEHHLELGGQEPGAHTVVLPATGMCRVLVRGDFGSVWSEGIAVAGH